MKTALILGLLLSGSLAALPSAARHPPPAQSPDQALSGLTAEAVEGRDTVRVELPAGILVDNYANLGYRLVREGRQAQIAVTVTPLESRAPFALSPLSRRERRGKDPVRRLARSLSGGASTQYEASSLLLAWVADHLEYRLDRSLSQEPEDVLRRGDAYCTGSARLAVALHQAVGIKAREVAGWDAQTSDFHRWIEVHYADRGWVFSDPLTTHHWVPATFVRLSNSEVHLDPAHSGQLLSRQDRVTAVDVYPLAREGVRARRNDPFQRAATLAIELEEPLSGEAVLEGWTVRWSREIVRGATTFLGLAPGRYRLRLHVAGLPALERTVEFEDHVRQVLFLPRSAFDLANESLELSRE